MLCCLKVPLCCHTALALVVRARVSNGDLLQGTNQLEWEAETPLKGENSSKKPQMKMVNYCGHTAKQP